MTIKPNQYYQITFPIQTVASLEEFSEQLDEPLPLLKELAAKTDSLYRLSIQKKRNGEPRETFEAFEPLKRVQEKIVNRYFSNITFPYYLHGAIKDKVNPRGTYSNALTHARSNYFIFLDVENFFASVSITQVLKIFQSFLGLNIKVVQLLADLVIYKGGIAPGASSSNYIANILFWDIEPELVQHFEASGLRYSRFIDDIIISSSDIIDNKNMGEIISKVINMLAAKGCKLKRRKLHVRKKGQIINNGKFKEPITITGFGIHNSVPNVSKVERKKIRASVHQLEQRCLSGESWKDAESEYRRIMGRMAKMKACGHSDTEKLKAILTRIKALHDKRPTKVS